MRINKNVVNKLKSVVYYIYHRQQILGNYNMFNMILQTLFGFIVIQGICSKSIQNVTIDDSKFVTTDMLENWKKNMTDWMTELFERKCSSLFFSQRLCNSYKSCKLSYVFVCVLYCSWPLVPEGIICPVVSP